MVPDSPVNVPPQPDKCYYHITGTISFISLTEYVNANMLMQIYNHDMTDSITVV